jgi:hypothetical protein
MASTVSRVTLRPNRSERRRVLRVADADGDVGKYA